MKNKYTIALIGFDWVQQFPVLDYGGIEKMVEDEATALHKLGIRQCLLLIAPHNSTSFQMYRSLSSCPKGHGWNIQTERWRRIHSK
jgi:hypothetical protein